MAMPEHEGPPTTAVSSETKAEDIDANGKPFPSKLAEVANAEPSPSEPMNDANPEPAASELVNGVNAKPGASETKIDKGASVLVSEGGEKVSGGKEKAEDKIEEVQHELKVGSTPTDKVKKKQKKKKKKMLGAADKKKASGGDEKGKDEKGKEEKEAAAQKEAEVEKIMKGIINDAGKGNVLGAEEKLGEKSKEEVANDVKVDATPNEKTNRKRKRVKNKTNKRPADASKEILADDENSKKNEVQHDAKVATFTQIEKADNERKRRKHNNKPEDSDDAVAKNADKPKSSGAGKAPKKAKSMGLIFMCNSKTKKDCYRYNVLGLPENKKNLVAKVYKGMRLFLYDIDLRLLYGIYKAAGPGGYNIEPKAFKSAFPSQVRFSVLRDCLPLAVEKFKAAIKDNYFGRNKFNCQLTAEQVKSLCKLFRATTKAPSKPKQSGRVAKPESPIPADRDRKRSRVRGRVAKSESPIPADRDRKRSRVRGRVAKRESPITADRDRKRTWVRGRVAKLESPIPADRDRKRSRVHARARRPLLDGDDRYLRHHDMYERDAYASYASPQHPIPFAPPSYAPPALPPPSLPAPSYASTLLPPPLPPRSYAYEQPFDVDYFRRDPLTELHDQRRNPLPEIHDRRRDPLPELHDRRRDPLPELHDRRRDPLPELHDRRPIYPELRPRSEVEYPDPYSMYRDPAPSRDPFFPAGVPSATSRDPLFPAGIPSEPSRDPLYPTGLQSAPSRDILFPAGLPPGYHPSYRY